MDRGLIVAIKPSSMAVEYDPMDEKESSAGLILCSVRGNDFNACCGYQEESGFMTSELTEDMSFRNWNTLESFRDVKPWNETTDKSSRTLIRRSEKARY